MISTMDQIDSKIAKALDHLARLIADKAGVPAEIGFGGRHSWEADYLLSQHRGRRTDLPAGDIGTCIGMILDLEDHRRAEIERNNAARRELIERQEADRLAAHGGPTTHRVLRFRDDMTGSTVRLTVPADWVETLA